MRSVKGQLDIISVLKYLLFCGIKIIQGFIVFWFFFLSFSFILQYSCLLLGKKAMTNLDAYEKAETSLC